MSSISQSSAGARQRTHTAKGEEQYEERKAKFSRSLLQLWGNVQITVEKIQDVDSPDTLQKVENDLLLYYETYMVEAKNCLEFMDRTRTQESKHDLDAFSMELENKSQFFEDARMELFKRKMKFERCEGSVKSRVSSTKSAKSTKSQISTIVAKTRARAEAEKERLKYEKKAAEMKKKRAELDAQISVLEQEKNVAAAEVELNVLQSEESSMSDKEHSEHAPLPQKENDEELNKIKRTIDYVESQVVSSPLHNLQKSDVNHQPCVPTTAGTVMSDVTDIARFLLKKDL